MSYQEGPHAFGHFIELTCDTERKGHKLTSAYIATNTREGCNQLLLAMGWSLHRGKQMCPKCTRRILKAMERKRSAGGAQ